MIGCIYHSADLDGHLSASIVGHYFRDSEVQFIYANYPMDQQKIFELIYKKVEKGSQLFMVDYSMPLDMMRKLDWDYEFVWIDHHKVVDDYHLEGFRPEGLQIDSSRYTTQNPVIYEGDDIELLKQRLAACELAWLYFYGDRKMPTGLVYAGSYDSWRYVDAKDPLHIENVLDFTYGTRALDWKINEDPSFCTNLMIEDRVLVISTMNKGRVVRSYVDRDNKMSAANAFETTLDGVSALVLNKSGVNSLVFASRPGYDLYIAFYWDGRNKQWVVKLFSENVDVSEIAKKYGGGGHKGAAGFQVATELPFAL